MIYIIIYLEVGRGVGVGSWIYNPTLCWELGVGFTPSEVGSWELGFRLGEVGSWELGAGFYT